MSQKLNTNKFLCLLILILIVLLLTGCWDRQEVNDLALVIATGIDKKSDDTIELSVQVYIPKASGSQKSMEGGSGGGNEQTLVRSAEGITIADAMSKLQEKLPRLIFWGHNEVLIFEDELAKDGITSHIDFILRHPQLRQRSQLFVSKQKAKEILSLSPPLERDSSEVLRELGNLKIGMEVTTKEVSQMLISESGDCALPLIKILPPEAGKDNKETIAYITGTALFKHDKMVGQIDDSVTRGLLWLRNEVRLAIITVQPEKAEGYVSMNLLLANSKLIPKIEDGKWKIILKTESDVDIIQNTTHLDMSKPEVVEMLEKQLDKETKNKVRLALAQVQKDMKTDIIGFADSFHRAYPDVWEHEKHRWDEIFPNVEVTIETKSKIHTQGMNSVLSSILPEEVRNK